MWKIQAPPKRNNDVFKHGVLDYFISKWRTIEGMTRDIRLEVFEKLVSFYKYSNQLNSKQNESRSPELCSCHKPHSSFPHRKRYLGTKINYMLRLFVMSSFAYCWNSFWVIKQFYELVNISYELWKAAMTNSFSIRCNSSLPWPDLC